MSHRHHWIVESPDGFWSLGRCKNCHIVDAFPNSNREVSEFSKRQFLREKGISKPYSEEEKKPIVEYAVRHSVNRASIEFDLPSSTIHNWVQPLGSKTANKDKYTEEFKESCIEKYKETFNFYRTSIETGVPRSTLQTWIKIDAS